MTLSSVFYFAACPFRVSKGFVMPSWCISIGAVCFFPIFGGSRIVGCEAIHQKWTLPQPRRAGSAMANAPAQIPLRRAGTAQMVLGLNPPLVVGVKFLVDFVDWVVFEGKMNGLAIRMGYLKRKDSKYLHGL